MAVAQGVWTAAIAFAAALGGAGITGLIAFITNDRSIKAQRTMSFEDRVVKPRGDAYMMVFDFCDAINAWWSKEQTPAGRGSVPQPFPLDEGRLHEIRVRMSALATHSGNGEDPRVLELFSTYVDSVLALQKALTCHESDSDDATVPPSGEVVGLRPLAQEMRKAHDAVTDLMRRELQGEA
jgi:hypothetical protein